MPTYTFHIYRLPDFVSRPPVNSSSSSTTSITGSSVTPIAIEVTDDDTGLTYNDSNQIITNSSDPNLIGLRITWSTSAMTNSVSPTHPNGSNLFIKALTISSGGSTTGGENFALAWQNNQTNGATDVLRPNTVYNNIPGNTGTFRIPYSNINDPSITFGDGYVDGTEGSDIIDVAYTGDPDGDRIDANDAILAGEAPNDDIVDARGGDDRVSAGLGNDDVYAGGGNDTVFGGSGADLIFGDSNRPGTTPSNGSGNDVLNGEAGNDTILGQGGNELLGGQGNDEIVGGSGDDSIDGGIGDDTIEGGEGSDTVQGGAGDDVIDSSNGLTPSDTLAPDIGYPGIFDADTDPFNDRDSVDGGAGNDTIFTGDDRDTITGGDGDDVIDAGIDDDSVDGGAGDDRIVGGEGNDTIDAGAGDDTIFSGNDPLVVPDGLDIEDDGTNPLGPDLAPDNGIDSVRGGAGNDVIFGADDDDRLFGDDGDDVIDGQIDDDFIDGGAGDDELLGGQGNDEIVGGSGDDSIDGGIGDDTIEGGIGNDNLSGGDDRDTFENVNAGDVVDGNEGGDDFDTLDLRGSAPAGGSLNIVFDPSNIENGEVFYFDDNGDPAGSLVFTNIEAVIPCFTPGTRIATPRGEIKVEALQVGDRVITRDRGIQEIRWVGQRALTGAELAMAKHLRPVLIRQGALGNDLPERDMMVSPNHRVLMANNETALYFEDSEVLVAAKHLTGLDGVDIVDASCVTYIHLMFDQHEVVLSDGAWTESFQPGDQTLGAMGDAQRNEIFELFPELSTPEGVEAYGSARRALKKHEAKLLIQ